MTTRGESLANREPIDLIGMFEHCPEMLAILTVEGEFYRASASSLRTVGHPNTGLTGRLFFELVHADDARKAVREFQRAVDTAGRVSFRSRFQTSDGRYRWIQWSLCRPPENRLVYAVARDVSDHSSTEQELARVNQILSTVLLSAPLPIWASDPEGRIQFWNESAECVLGWTAEEVLQGQPPDSLPRCTGEKEPERLLGDKRSWRRKDGSTREFRFWTAPLYENGAACGTLGMAVDVTEYDAEVYEALQRAYDDLRNTRDAVMQHERLRVLGQMASGIAHDINNALAPMKLYTQVLLEDERGLTQQGRASLITIRKAIDDVTETVARLREFYRPTEPPALVPLRLNDLSHEVLDLTRARWRDISQQAGIAIEVATELSADLPLVLGIESEIREAVINLIFNAVDAMPSGGTLTLRTGIRETDALVQQETAVAYAYIEVADTGSGMDENTLRRCMEPFFTTKGERGTGLGLAMVYGIAQRNNGSIEIESTPGKGTTMRLRFPIPRSPVAQLNAAIETEVFSPRRILVVDDDPLVAEVMRDILHRDGHQVTVVEGGEAGISAFREASKSGAPFEIVLTDLGMPHVDGRRVAAAIKSESAHTPVILLTGWGRRMVADGDMPPGVDQLLSKPADLNELRHAIAACFDPR
ncbi:MAG TPA: PAS domain S-box protein [Bryobacteraceae bacterium]|nr:PAS domain S-box protein [Bryobacteraceae bacterium]